MEGKLFNLEKFVFFNQKASTIYHQMSATDKEHLKEDAREQIEMTTSEQSKRCRIILLYCHFDIILNSLVSWKILAIVALLSLLKVERFNCLDVVWC